MNITLVIPAHNEEQHIGPCIDSVIENGGARFAEIIVVDNASTDRTSEFAGQKPGVRIVSEPRKGLTIARERGRLEARGDYVAYIDADCRLTPGWIDFVEHFFSEQPGAVCLSGPPIYFDASSSQRLFLEMAWRIAAPLARSLVGYVIYGAHFVVRKVALDSIGGFDTKIQFYGEDTDLARRLAPLGHVVFRMDFPVLTSARRYSAQGNLRTAVIYALNYVWPAFFERPFSKVYRDFR
jgi:glycosyltransferase involved in cell wall biosynthesis